MVERIAIFLICFIESLIASMRVLPLGSCRLQKPHFLIIITLMIRFQHKNVVGGGTKVQTIAPCKRDFTEILSWWTQISLFEGRGNSEKGLKKTMRSSILDRASSSLTIMEQKQNFCLTTSFFIGKCFVYSLEWRNHRRHVCSVNCSKISTTFFLL